MKKTKLLKSLKSAEKKRELCIAKFKNPPSMIRGSFHKTFTKCGRKECKCATGKGHPCQRITWREESKARTKGVPVSQEEWVRKMTKNYKDFRENRKKIKMLEVKINSILNELEAEIVAESWEKNTKFEI